MRRLLALGAFLAVAPAAHALAQQPAPGARPSAPLTRQEAAVDGSQAQQAPPADLPPGQRTLNLCRACHTIDKGARTLIGPNLHGVFGRRAASVEGYRYSANMRQLGETGHVWSDETLRRYLTNPRAVVPQTAMQYPGIVNEQQLNEFLPLLKQVTGGP